MPTDTAPVTAVIICSTRQSRFCPQVAAFVIEAIEEHTTAGNNNTTPAKLHLIDLAAWNLPFLDEPMIASQIKNHADYAHEHTRAWSQEIQKYSAFIFVMPQYNWGYPAVIKNAIDFLYHEWSGKSAVIVSYGGRGGGKGAVQLRQVLNGVHMHVVNTMPALSYPSREIQLQASQGEQLVLSGKDGFWEKYRKDICNAYGELLYLNANGPTIIQSATEGLRKVLG